MKSAVQLFRLSIYSFVFAQIAAAGQESVADVAATSASSLSLAHVLATVAAENPSIKAAEQKWIALKARVPQAAAWEDLRLQAQSVTNRFVNIGPNGFTDQSVMLQQELPLTGKNRSRARAATAEAGGAFEDFRRRKLDTISRARAAYYRLANEYAQLDLNRRNVELLNQFAKISRDRYEVGNARQADVLTAETDAAKLVEAESDILRRVSDAQTELNVLMNRAAQTPLGSPGPLEFQRAGYSLSELQSAALVARPEIQRAQNRIDAEKGRVELAQRQRVPDPTVNVQAQRYNDTGQAVSELNVGVSVGLPFLNGRKYSAGIAEAQGNLAAAEDEFEAAKNETLGLVRDHVKKVETAAHHYELYRDKIVPLARQTVQSTRTSYEASSATFLELITSQRVLQEAEATSLEHLADYYVALAELRATVGADDRSDTRALRTGSRSK